MWQAGSRGGTWPDMRNCEVSARCPCFTKPADTHRSVPSGHPRASPAGRLRAHARAASSPRGLARSAARAPATRMRLVPRPRRPRARPATASQGGRSCCGEGTWGRDKRHRSAPRPGCASLVAHPPIPSQRGRRYDAADHRASRRPGDWFPASARGNRDRRGPSRPCPIRPWRQARANPIRRRRREPTPTCVSAADDRAASHSASQTTGSVHPRPSAASAHRCQRTDANHHPERHPMPARIPRAAVALSPLPTARRRYRNI